MQRVVHPRLADAAVQLSSPRQRPVHGRGRPRPTASDCACGSRRNRARDGVDGLRTRRRRTGARGCGCGRSPDKGEANAALEEVVADWLGVPKSTRRGVRRAASRAVKTLEIAGDPAAAAQPDRPRLHRQAGIARRRGRDGRRKHHRRQGDRRSAAPRGGRRRRGARAQTRGHHARASPSCWSGEDPASQVYVRTKAKATRDAGMRLVRAQAAGRDVARQRCWP